MPSFGNVAFTVMLSKNSILFSTYVLTIETRSLLCFIFTGFHKTLRTKSCRTVV